MSEFEYMALVDIVNESRFLWQVKASIVPPVDYKMHVNEENEVTVKNVGDMISGATKCTPIPVAHTYLKYYTWYKVEH